jgi:hypothetical protein
MRRNPAAVDTSDYTKDELGAAVNRLRATATKYKDKAKATAEEFMSTALMAGSAFGVGWWIGQTRLNNPGDAEALQFWGIDKELVIGLGLLFGGISGFLGKQMSGAASAMGKGVLAYYAGTQGEAIGSQAA